MGVECHFLEGVSNGREQGSALYIFLFGVIFETYPRKTGRGTGSGFGPWNIWPKH